MKVTYFIDRPVFSMVISILIVIVGFIGLTLLPIDQYPQITPPVVKISASYPGASALTVSQAVATPIEQELNGTPGMLYMESSSSNSGGFSATVTFDISADPDLAAVEIQNRVKLAESRLPAEVIQNGISVEKQAPSQLMTLCLTSDDPKFDEIYLSNFATINVLDVLRRIPGVGRVSNIGSRYYAMQIWVQPDKLANFGLTVQDVQNALKDQNRESAAGVLGQQPIEGLDITIPISTKGRLSTVSQFEEIVLRADADGSLIRLRDVARISLEAQSYNTESGINGGNAAVLGIYMLPGANAMEVAENVKKAMDEISKNFPEGLEYEIPFDMTTYISESIHEVYKTLFEALVLVIFVVFLSLQSWRGHRYCGGRRYRRGRERGTHHGRRTSRRIRSHKESHDRTGRCPDSHIIGIGSRVRASKLPAGHHGTTLPPVHRNDCGIGTDFYGSCPDAKSGHVLAHPETGRPEQT